jgi:hypothetical protein
VVLRAALREHHSQDRILETQRWPDGMKGIAVERPVLDRDTLQAVFEKVHLLHVEEGHHNLLEAVEYPVDIELLVDRPLEEDMELLHKAADGGQRSQVAVVVLRTVQHQELRTCQRLGCHTDRLEADSPDGHLDNRSTCLGGLGVEF